MCQGRLIVASGGQQRPEDAGLLRREGHDSFIEPAPSLERRESATSADRHRRVS